MPNGELFTNAVVVNTAYGTRRSEYDVGVGYDTDVARAKTIMLDTTRQVDGVLDEPEPEVLTVALGDSAIVLRLRWWTASDSSAVVHTSDRVVASVAAALDDAGVDIPYPVRTVLLHPQEASD